MVIFVGRQNPAEHWSRPLRFTLGCVLRATRVPFQQWSLLYLGNLKRKRATLLPILPPLCTLAIVFVLSLHFLPPIQFYAADLFQFIKLIVCLTQCYCPLLDCHNGDVKNFKGFFARFRPCNIEMNVNKRKEIIPVPISACDISYIFSSNSCTVFIGIIDTASDE